MRQEFNLTNLLMSLWRFKWVLIIVALVAGGTAWKFTSSQPVSYQATATVMVESSQPRMTNYPVGLDMLLAYAYPQNIESQIQMISSRAVLERAVAKLEPDKATDPDYLQMEASSLLGSLTTQQIGNTTLVALTVAASDPISAQEEANAIAEAYVYEANNSTLTALNTALSNINSQLKGITTSKIDLSTDPSLTLATAQIDATLAALKVASDRLQQTTIKPAPVTQSKTTSPGEDIGTTLTETQINTIRNLLKEATDNAKEISDLAQTKLQPAKRGFLVPGEDIALIESRVRVLSTKLSSLSTELDTIVRAETDPEVHDKLLALEGVVQVASATQSALLTQMVSLYTVQGQFREASTNGVPYSIETQNRYEAARANLFDLLGRIDQHTASVSASLLAASEQAKNVEARPATSRLDMLRRTISERITSMTATLQDISKQLQPGPSGKSVLLTYPELAAIQVRVEGVATTLTSLVSDMQAMLDTNPDLQEYSALLNLKNVIQTASDTASVLPTTVTNLIKGGGGNISYTSLDNLRQQLQLTLLTASSGGSRVMDKAVASMPSSGIFKHLRNTVLAMIVALLLAAVIVLVLQYIDRTVRDASQVTRYIGLPLLARVARLKAAGNPHPPSVLSGSPPYYLEAFRMLRTNLGLDSAQGQVLLVTSPEDKEGKTTVASNLARSVAMQDRKVLLIDCDLRNPHVAAAFGIAETEGLSGFLTGKNEPWSYIKQVDGVDILPAGAPSIRSAELLSSPRMKALLEKARQTYDVVIVDSTPVIGCADTVILARKVDEVLLVIQSHASKMELIRDSKQTLETTGVRVVGFVFTNVEPKEFKYLHYPLENKLQVREEV